ncbi:hypothetical protein LDC_2959 [sediment metagenome]|uniref:Uncharacterized protein n=1 Tax=sediment metagenome TaxID=749907 RepID=D9PN30_9ZZZZ
MDPRHIVRAPARQEAAHGGLHVAGERNQGGDFLDRQRLAHLVHGAQNVLVQQGAHAVGRHLIGFQGFPDAHGAQFEGAGVDDEPVFDQQQPRAAAADFRDEHMPLLERRFPLEEVMDREVDQVFHLGILEHVHGDARPDIDPVEKGLAVRRLADRTGGHGPDLIGRGDAVLAHDMAKAAQDDDALLDRGAIDAARSKGVLAQVHGLLQGFQQPDVAAGADLGNVQPDGAAADIDHGDRAGARRGGDGGCGGISHGSGSCQIGRQGGGAHRSGIVAQTGGSHLE